MGDRVKCVRNKNRSLGNKSDHDGYGAGWKPKLVFEITRIDSTTNGDDTKFKPNVYWGGINTDGVFADCVQKV